MKASAFAYARATSVANALDLLVQHGERAKVLSGGQSLIPAMNLRLISPELIVDIGDIEELRGISVQRETLVIGALTRRLPSVDWAAVDDVVLGCANQAGEDNRNVARMAGLLAGLPVEVPGTTVNRLCGSGLDAVAIAARAVRTGEADLVIAGGVESMTRAPLVMPKAGAAWSRYSPEDQALIRGGGFRVGLDELAVYVARGTPDVYWGTTLQGQRCRVMLYGIGADTGKGNGGDHSTGISRIRMTIAFHSCDLARGRMVC